MEKTEILSSWWKHTVILILAAGFTVLIWLAVKSYWHARGPEFLNQKTVRILEWLRMPGDLVFIGLGVLPVVAAAVITNLRMNKKQESKTDNS